MYVRSTEKVSWCVCQWVVWSSGVVWEDRWLSGVDDWTCLAARRWRRQGSFDDAFHSIIITTTIIIIITIIIITTIIIIIVSLRPCGRLSWQKVITARNSYHILSCRILYWLYWQVQRWPPAGALSTVDWTAATRSRVDWVAASFSSEILPTERKQRLKYNLEAV